MAIKYFGGKQLYDTDEIDSIALDAEQNAKDYADGKFQEKLTIDSVVTTGSNNPVSSDAVDTALSAKADETYVDNQVAVGLNAAKAYTDDEVASKQDALTFDATPTAGSDNPVTSDGLFTALDAKANLADVISRDDLDTEIADREAADTQLQDNIDAETQARIDAVRFASVKVGETMFWSKTSIEDRVCESDDPFTYTLNGVTRTITHIPSTTEELEVAISVPDGWLAMDGTSKAVADYPDLAAFFMPDNKIDDDHFWLPYVAKKIIKATY